MNIRPLDALTEQRGVVNQMSVGFLRRRLIKTTSRCYCCSAIADSESHAWWLDSGKHILLHLCTPCLLAIDGLFEEQWQEIWQKGMAGSTKVMHKDKLVKEGKDAKHI